MYWHFISTWRAGVRSHSFRALVLLAIALMGIAYFSGTLSGRHPQTVALDIGLSGIRLLVVLLLLFWTQDLLGKEIDKKTVFIALSYPISRSAYLLGRYAGIVCMIALAIGIMGGAIYGVVLASGGGYKQAFAVQFGVRYLVVLLFILFDVMTIAAFALLVSSFASSALIPFVVGAAFAFAARSFGTVLAFLLDKQGEGADIAHIYAPIMRAIGFVFPDLGQLDVRELVLYNAPLAWGELAWSAAHAMTYSGLLLVAACYLFSKREFS